MVSAPIVSPEVLFSDIALAMSVTFVGAVLAGVMVMVRVLEKVALLLSVVRTRME